MRLTRTPILAAAAFVSVLAAAGCGSNSCNDSPTPVKAAPTSCSAPAGARVTVPLQVCPKCDQQTPTCDVRSQGGTIFVEPVAAVCDPNSSCPLVDASSCPATPLSCQFTAPTPDTSNTFNVVVVGADSQTEFTLTVTGSAVNCSL